MTDLNLTLSVTARTREHREVFANHEQAKKNKDSVIVIRLDFQKQPTKIKQGGLVRIKKTHQRTIKTYQTNKTNRALAAEVGWFDTAMGAAESLSGQRRYHFSQLSNLK